MTYGLGIGRGFNKGRKNGWFIYVTQPDGCRPKEHYATEKARDKAYNDKVAEVRKVGAAASAPVSVADRHALAEMQQKASEAGLSLLDIFQRGLAQLGGISLSKLTVAQAAESFMAEQAHRLKDKKISAVRYKEIRLTVGRYVAANGKKPLALCTRTSIKHFLTGLGVGPQTRLNNARNLSFFFGWCIDEDMILKNPVPGQEGVSRIPTIFAQSQVDELFDCAWQYHPELIPLFALQWFAGIRPAATHRLNWEDIDFERCKILIHPQANKVKQSDIVKDIPVSVFGLLLQFKKKSGRIAHANHSKMTKDLHRRLGFGKKAPVYPWPEDVARHTFASNLFALYEPDRRRVEEVLLYSTGAMLKKHYLNKNITREQAETYFSRYLPSVPSA